MTLEELRKYPTELEHFPTEPLIYHGAYRGLVDVHSDGGCWTYFSPSCGVRPRPGQKLYTLRIPFAIGREIAQRSSPIQKLLPDATPAQREFLITGMLPEEQERIFGKPTAALALAALLLFGASSCASSSYCKSWNNPASHNTEQPTETENV